MSSLAPSPGGLPLGGALVSGTEITVDEYVNPPSRIPEIIRNLVDDNQGYFIEDVFGDAGFTVQGGAVLYTPTFPQQLFLDPEQSIAARAPGAEAPLLAGTLYEPQVARPESRAGRIEVTDEARQRNLVLVVQRQFQQAANTFADYMQTRGIAALNDAVTAWGRTVAGVNWRAAHTNGFMNADPATLPRRDFATVLAQFIADKTGVRPDTVILNQEDALYLDELYGGNPFMTGSLTALLERYGITNYRISPHQAEGTAIFCKSRSVGAIAWEKPLDQEYERAGVRKTDVFVLEMRPVFVAYDPSSIVAVTGIAG
jgi:hypothetical protein